MSYASSSNVRVQKWWNGLDFQNLPLSKFVKMVKEFTATLILKGCSNWHSFDKNENYDMLT